MIIAGIPILLIVVLAFGAFLIRTPKVAEYNRLDRIGIATNIILSILYVPMSLIGVASVFAFDTPHGAAVSAALGSLVPLGVSLPFVSLFFMILSVRFRRAGHSVASFVLQFIPLFVFAIHEIGLMMI